MTLHVDIRNEGIKFGLNTLTKLQSRGVNNLCRSYWLHWRISWKITKFKTHTSIWDWK